MPVRVTCLGLEKCSALAFVSTFLLPLLTFIFSIWFPTEDVFPCAGIDGSFTETMIACARSVLLVQNLKHGSQQKLSFPSAGIDGSIKEMTIACARSVLLV